MGGYARRPQGTLQRVQGLLLPDTRLYNEAFTGRACSIPRCPHCLSDDHSGTSCPHNPNPPILGWFQGSAPSQYAPAPQLPAPATAPASSLEVCRSFNANRYRFTQCRFPHVCSDCGGPHSALNCPHRQSSSTGRGPSARNRCCASNFRAQKLETFSPDQMPGFRVHGHKYCVLKPARPKKNLTS